MRRKIMSLVCLTAMLLGLLGGCGSVKFKPEKSGLFIKKDGSVVGAEIEPFDNSEFSETRYKEDELLAFVEEEVTSYNKEACGQEFAYAKDTKETLPVAIQSLTVESETASLFLTYATCKDYLAFNEADASISDLSLATAPEAVSGGLSLEGFTDAEGNAADTEKIAGSERYRVVSVTGTANLTVQGKIAAVSKGVTVIDSSNVSVAGEEASYIIFR